MCHITCNGHFTWSLYELVIEIMSSNTVITVSINEFQSAVTNPSRRLSLLRAYASWLHQSIRGLLQFGSSKGYKVVLRIEYPFRRSILLHTNDMAEPA